MIRRYLQSVRADDQDYEIGQTEGFEVITDPLWTSTTDIDHGETDDDDLDAEESEESEDDEVEYKLVWPYLDPPDPTDEHDGTEPPGDAA